MQYFASKSKDSKNKHKPYYKNQQMLVLIPNFTK